MNVKLGTPVVLFVLAALLSAPLRAEKPRKSKDVFAKDNLVAWCIVPFDAKHRSPAQRAEMLERLGIKRVAYDWRENHVPEFEEEILQYKKHGLEYTAFWAWHPAIAPLIEKHGIHPQIWITIPDKGGETQQQRVEASAKALLPLVEQVGKLGCKLALYNHGGWAGEPENLVAVTKWLRENAQADHVGIVYNFHHGHGHIADFAEVLAEMKPYLFCLNLNGMNEGARPKIVPIGSGQHELAMMKAIRDSGYCGPIGILDHRADTDTEETLRGNLEGMKKVLKELGDEEALATY